MSERHKERPQPPTPARAPISPGSVNGAAAAQGRRKEGKNTCGGRDDTQGGKIYPISRHDEAEPVAARKDGILQGLASHPCTHLSGGRGARECRMGEGERSASRCGQDPGTLGV
ncbi:hypothetical protein OIDMADRAFT_28698 [Oidiodendron maius Zn]|uniref:Uncharacterized protein n=1 Tax=Oidiodendron maius (strain Zn) TaxID=913774 RepID=A0A0C3CPM7_OIDMZ|nr:hypothetical protein OIDMADRAFT_28698 [Oidiodendron maius Zn]